MGVLRSGKLRVLVVTCVVLFLLLGVGHASSGPVLAQEDGPNQPFMCWVSGPLIGDDKKLESWTAHKDREFVVDLVGDVENRLPEQGVFEPRALIDGWKGTGDLPSHLIPFRTLREAVDYTFAINPRGADVVSGGANDGEVVDLRLGRLREVLGGTDITDDAWELGRALPWLTSDQYFKRRQVAIPSEDRIRVYRAQWLDRENPGGGLSTNIASMMRDMGAQDADLAAGTTSQPGGGSHLHVGQHEVPAMELRTTFDQSCSGPTCSALINLTSETVTVTATSSVQEWNDGMYSANTLGTGERPGMVVDDKGMVVSEPVDVDLGGVRKSSLPDQSGTSGAYAQRSQGDGGSDEFSVTLELDPFHREDFRWDGGDLGQDLIMRRFGSPRFRTVYKGYGENRTRFLGYNELGPDRLVGRILPAVHTGYRQPSLSRAFNVETEPLPFASVSHIRWPVDFQDLNWYLYQLPGEYQRGDMHWMLWLDGDAVQKLVNGGYGQSVTPLVDPPAPAPPAPAPVCELKGEVVLPKNINCEVDGADDLDALRKGEVTGVYFPFDTDDGSEGLNADMLVLQGVERPKEDEGQDVRSLSVFQFDVKEQEPMGRATESGGQAEARYGIPTEEEARKNYIDSWAPGGH